PLDSFEARPMPGTEGGFNPFFSPDGQWIGFWAGGTIKKVSVNGGTAQVVATTGITRGASWGSSGTIAFPPASTGPLQLAPHAGGPRDPLTPLEPGESPPRFPQFWPGGQSVLFAAGSGAASSLRIAAYSSATRERRTFNATGTSPHYVPAGY